MAVLLKPGFYSKEETLKLIKDVEGAKLPTVKKSLLIVNPVGFDSYQITRTLGNPARYYVNIMARGLI